MSEGIFSHPTAPQSNLLFTEIDAACQQGDPVLKEKALTVLNEYMCATIANGECPCCRLPLDLSIAGDYGRTCSVCGHIWVRHEQGSILTWVDAREFQASSGHTGSPGEAGGPYRGKHETPDPSGRDAARDQ